MNAIACNRHPRRTDQLCARPASNIKNASSRFRWKIPPAFHQEKPAIPHFPLNPTSKFSRMEGAGKAEIPFCSSRCLLAASHCIHPPIQSSIYPHFTPVILKFFEFFNPNSALCVRGPLVSKIFTPKPLTGSRQSQSVAEYFSFNFLFATGLLPGPGTKSGTLPGTLIPREKST